MHRSVGRCLSVLVALAFCNTAGAYEVDSWVEVEEKPTQFIFDEPGRLIIDASNDQALFPTVSEELSFATWGEFLIFMRDFFNASIVEAEDGPTFELEVRMVGEPYWLELETMEAIPVVDPITTFLGGQTGYMTIGDSRFCVTDACREREEGAGASSLAAINSNGGSSLSAMAAAPAFVIDGFSTIYDVIWFMDEFRVFHALRPIYAETVELGGGFKRFVAKVLPGDGKTKTLTMPDGRTIEFIDFRIVSIRRGQNFLRVELYPVDWAKDPNGCPIVPLGYYESSGPNVPKVSTLIFAGEGRPVTYASGTYSRHAGVELETFQTDAFATWYRSGGSYNSACRF